MKRKRKYKPVRRAPQKKKRKIKAIDINQEEKMFIYRHIAECQLADKKTEFVRIAKIAIKRKYPFAEETEFLLNVLRTANFMIPILGLLQQTIQRQKNNTPRRVKKHCKILSGETSKRNKERASVVNECVIVNLRKLFDLINSYILFNTSSVSKELSSRIEFNTFTNGMSYFCDVYACLYHPNCIHVCKHGFCSRTFKTSNLRMCYTSLKQHELIDECPPTWEHDGFDRGKSNRKPFHLDVHKTFKKTIFTSNNKRLDIDVDLIVNKLSSFYMDFINFNELKNFVFGQISMFGKMIDNKILKCENAYSEVVSKRKRENLITNKKNKKRKKKTTTKVPKKKRNPKRKSRKVVVGHFEKKNQTKIRIHEVPKTVNFKNALKKFEKLMKEIKTLENTRVLEYTHVLNAKRYTSYVNSILEEEEGNEEKVEKIIHGPRSKECFYVDPVPTSWGIPYENAVTKVKKAHYLYMRFFNDEHIQKVLKSDDGNELTLRCKTHEWLSSSSAEFIKSIPRISSFVRRLTPSKFRIVMFAQQIIDECNKKYTQLKNTLKSLHRKDCMPNYCDYDRLLEYDYWKNYFHFTLSDEMMLELCEYLYWCKKMCESHPHIEVFGFEDVTEEVIFVGGLFLLKVGLKYKGTHPIIMKHPLFEKRGFLVSQNELGTVLIHRGDASKGITVVTNIMTSLCDLRGPENVAFLEWKSEHGELSNFSR
jgi:hypothetical protein